MSARTGGAHLTPYSTAGPKAMSSFMPSIFWHRGLSALRLPIEERRKLLTQALRKVQYPVIQSMPFDVTPAELFRAAKELGFEGVIGPLHRFGWSSNCTSGWKSNQAKGNYFSFGTVA